MDAPAPKGGIRKTGAKTESENTTALLCTTVHLYKAKFGVLFIFFGIAITDELSKDQPKP